MGCLAYCAYLAVCAAFRLPVLSLGMRPRSYGHAVLLHAGFFAWTFTVGVEVLRNYGLLES